MSHAAYLCICLVSHRAGTNSRPDTGIPHDITNGNGACNEVGTRCYVVLVDRQGARSLTTILSILHYSYFTLKCFVLAEMKQSEQIPSLAHTSLSGLESLTRMIGNTLPASAAETSNAGSHLAKLKLWSGSVGAHHISGARSLEYRLGDASFIRQTFVSLLEHLNGYIKEGKTLW